MKRQNFSKIKSIPSFFFYLCVLALLSLSFPALSKEIPHSTKNTPAHAKITLLKTQIKQQPQNMLLRQALLREYLQSQRMTEASQLLHETQLAFPTRVEPLLMQARMIMGSLSQNDWTYFNDKQISALNTLAQSAERITIHSPDVFYLQGLSAIANDQPNLAEPLFLQALQKNQNHIPSLEALSNLYLSQNRIQEASSLLMQLVELEAGEADTLFLMGKAFLHKGNPQKALDYLAQCSAKEPGNKPARLALLLQAHEKLKDWPSALQEYQTLLALWPKRGDLWLNYAKLLSAQNRTEDAQLAYQTAFTLQPGNLEALIHKAQDSFWQSSPIQSAPLYLNLLQLNPQDPSIACLATQIFFQHWQRTKQPPNPEQLHALHKQIILLEHQTPLPELALADLELQVIKQGVWTPGLLSVLKQLQSNTLPAPQKAWVAILLNQPSKAKSILWSLPVDSPDETLQWLFLTSAWNPYNALAKQSNRNQNVSLSAGTLHQQQAQGLIREAEANPKSHAAQQLLQQAYWLDPLSPQIQLHLAKTWLNLGDPNKAQQYLSEARALGLSEADMTVTTQLEKQIAKRLR